VTPARYIMLLILATAFAVAAVAQQARVVHLGYRVRLLDEERAKLVERDRLCLCDISALAHPARIAEAAGRLDIGLLDPVALTQASAGEEPNEETRSPQIAVR